MLRFAESNQSALLALVAVLAGCAAPADRHEPISLAAVATTARPLSGPVAEPRPHDAGRMPAIPVAYQAPADIPRDPPGAADEAPARPGEADQRGPLQPAPVPGASTQGPSAAARQPGDHTDDPCDPFNGQAELSVEQLVAEVQARNPSLQAASAAWRAAAERYPQAVSLDDPMFTSMISPSGVGTDDGGGWMVQASQRYPWRGKRALRGSAAAAEADVVQGDIGDTRLRLAEAARMAFYDYYLARRQMDVNASTVELVGQFRQIARNKYELSQATEQDVLQTDVELANLESRGTELARDEQVAVARINTLLHRAPDHPLPPPPAKVPVPDSLPTADVLQEAAARSRPDLFAQQARVRAEEANLALACREYYPDLSLVARYDGFMPENMRPQVGMDMNVPIRLARRSAAVREASDRLCQRRAEYQDRLDQVRYEVQSALARVAQSQRVVHLYEEKILPATGRSLESAQANYTSGKLDFLRLLDAERQVNTQREMYYQSIAEYHRRLAELQRAVGEPLQTTL